MTTFTDDEQRMINHIVATVSRTIMARFDAKLAEVRDLASEMAATVTRLQDIVMNVLNELDEENREETINDLLEEAEESYDPEANEP